MSTTTKQTIEEVAAILASAELGAPKTVEYDGHTYRCSVEIDEDHSLMDGDDGDWYGELAWVERDRWSGHDEPRPSGFNGRARKIQGDGRQMDDAVWWQPPTDVADEHLDEMQSNIQELLMWGFIGLTVERLDGVDAYGRPIVVDVASLWGIESFADDAYKVEIIGELVREVMAS